MSCLRMGPQCESPYIEQARSDEPDIRARRSRYGGGQRYARTSARFGHPVASLFASDDRRHAHQHDSVPTSESGPNTIQSIS